MLAPSNHELKQRGYLPRNAERLVNEAKEIMILLTRRILLAVSLGMLIAPFVHAQKPGNILLYQIAVGNKSGFIDQTGTIVIQPKFDGARYMLSDFSEGLAEFKDMKAMPGYPFSKEGFMDSSGRVVIKPQFDAKVDYGTYVDKTGKIIWQPTKQLFNK